MLACLSENVAHDINQGVRQSGKAAFRAFLAHMARCYSERLTDIVMMANDVGTRGEVFWVNLTDPTPEEESLVFGRFMKVHTLTLEDITLMRREPDHGAHFPKVEEFPDYLFVIVNPLPPGLSKLAQAKGKPAKGEAQLRRAENHRLLSGGEHLLDDAR